jgi:hypothetical protein
MVIKKETTDFKGEHFVFCFDFSEEIKKLFKKMLNFVQIFNAKLSLVMICTPNSFKTTLARRKLLMILFLNLILMTTLSQFIMILILKMVSLISQKTSRFDGKAHMDEPV